LRMKHITCQIMNKSYCISFNSFEDETESLHIRRIHKAFQLSIPLRMKLKVFTFAGFTKHFNFQFLWGWNHIYICHSVSQYTLSIPLRMKHNWKRKNKTSAICLSIPMRMKHYGSYRR